MAVRLVDLEARLMRFDPPRTFINVRSLAKADCVMFLCPACFLANGGKVGTHRIRIDFAGRGVTDEICIKNGSGQPVRWNVSGTGLEDLSLTPSILILGGCNWHGFVTAGNIAGAG
jgi:hypothetical protein